MKLICPRDNWQDPQEVSEREVGLLRHVAQRLNLTFRVDDQAGKVYLDQRRPGDAAAPATPQGVLRLNVPYYSQRDSATNQASRMCFSSSCAMLLAYLKPGILSGPNGDDQYLERVLRFGDTTSADAQLRALASYGVTASFGTGMGWDDVDALLDQGIPVPIGILHHGPVTAPTGGGHWIVIIGRTGGGGGYYVHDPAGELDLVSGGYDGSRSGAALIYSRPNLGRRWMVEGPGSGWGIRARRP